MTSHPTSPSLLYAVKQVELVVRSHLDQILKPSGVTALQYTAMTVLHRRSGLTAAQLARNSFVKTQSMADLVLTLERQGYVTRERDPEDGRRALLSLTTAGHDLLVAHEKAVAALEARMTADLTPDQVDGLRDALNACRSALATEPAH